MKNTLISKFTAIFLVMLWGCIAVGEEGAFENPPIFQSGQILTSDQLRGPYHRVRDAAQSDGFMIHFTIDSDFGVFQCVGKLELERRIKEIEAIAILVKVSKSDLFAKGLKQSVEKPIEAVKNIAEDPVESVKKVPETVGHFLSKMNSSIDRASKKIERKVRNSGEEDIDMETVKESGVEVGHAMRSVAGFDSAKLDCARQLGVDPYSDNERLQSEMDKVTWVFFAGGLPLRIGTSVVGGVASAAVTATKTVGLPEDIYDTTPGELVLRDRETLEALGASKEQIDAILVNPVASTSIRHSIVRSLQLLPPGEGRRGVISMLGEVEERRRLIFLADVLRLLQSRHQSAPYDSLELYQRLPVGEIDGEKVEIVAPVDFVSWTEQMANFVRSSSRPGSENILILHDGISQRAKKELINHGWLIKAL